LQGRRAILGAEGGINLVKQTCQSLVRLMGGDIALESVPGQGSTF
jgi:signal transduction histidine kinase